MVIFNKEQQEGIRVYNAALEKFFSLLIKTSRRYDLVWYFNLMLAYSSKVTGVEDREIIDILDRRGGEGMPLGVRTVLDEIYEKGIQKGIEQGLVIEAQEMVLSAISVKLGEVPKDIEEKIKAETDREKLKRILKDIILADDVLRVLRKYYK